MRKLILFSLILSAGAAFGQKSYQRTLTVVDPCSGSGISSQISEGFEVFPNPSKGLIHFNLPSSGNATLTDMKGLLIKESPVSAANQWDISQLSAGVYFLSLYTESKLFRTKLILEK